MSPAYTKLKPTPNAPVTSNNTQPREILNDAPESSSPLLEFAPAVTVTVGRPNVCVVTTPVAHSVSKGGQEVTVYVVVYTVLRKVAVLVTEASSVVWKAQC